MLKKIDVEVHSEGDCRRLLLLFFMSYHKLLHKWRIEGVFRQDFQVLFFCFMWHHRLLCKWRIEVYSEGDCGYCFFAS
jgi:hypothetical protein